MRKRSSSWANGDFEAQHPKNPDVSITLSNTELHLIQHIRSLELGAHRVFIVKSKRGKEGLTTFKITANIEDETG